MEIFKNTKNDQTIVLIAISDTRYMKETYEGADITGSLRSSKTVDLPTNRDGVDYENIDQLFAHLIENDEYQLVEI